MQHLPSPVGKLSKYTSGLKETTGGSDNAGRSIMQHLPSPVGTLSKYTSGLKETTGGSDNAGCST